jgi:hypothetical protein
MHNNHRNLSDIEGGVDVRHSTTDNPDWTVEIDRIGKRYNG